MLTLAQQATPKGDIMPALLWLGVLIVATVVLGLVVLAVRKRVLANSSDVAHEAGLMDSLRAMRDRGEMTNEEFEATRRAMIERVRANLSTQGVSPKPNAPPPTPHSGGPKPRPPARG